MGILEEVEQEIESCKDEVASSLMKLLRLDPRKMYELAQTKPSGGFKDKEKELLYWVIYLWLTRYTLDNANKSARR